MKTIFYALSTAFCSSASALIGAKTMGADIPTALIILFFTASVLFFILCRYKTSCTERVEKEREFKMFDLQEDEN